MFINTLAVQISFFFLAIWRNQYFKKLFALTTDSATRVHFLVLNPDISIWNLFSFCAVSIWSDTHFMLAPWCKLLIMLVLFCQEVSTAVPKLTRESSGQSSDLNILSSLNSQVIWEIFCLSDSLIQRCTYCQNRLGKFICKSISSFPVFFPFSFTEINGPML